MKRSPLVEIAHKALQDRDKYFAEQLLNTVNLTLLEKEIIKLTEIEGLKVEPACMKLEFWHNDKRACSYSNANYIKRKGMVKIAEYLHSLPPNYMF